MARQKGKQAHKKAAFSAADLIAKAEAYVEALDLETAAKYYERAIEIVRWF